VFAFLAMDVYTCYWLLVPFVFSWPVIYLVALLNFIFITGFILNLTQYKRVYLKDAQLYVYHLYSMVPDVFPLTDLKNVKRDNSKYEVLWGIYIATFYVEGSEYKVKFMKDKLIFDLSKYI
jgi:hypothetical protein